MKPEDTWRIQKAINQILRAVVDSVLVRLQPPLKHVIFSYEAKAEGGE